MKYPRQAPRTCLFAVFSYDFVPLLRVFLPPHCDLLTDTSDTDTPLVLPRISLRLPPVIALLAPLDDLDVFIKVLVHRYLHVALLVACTGYLLVLCTLYIPIRVYNVRT